jgi:2-polyprenyl-6-methoxyphenol hydroxylase-like FAD-dependent oxidoreductase
MQQAQVRTARRPMRVVIVGAGIGGLAAGAILRRDGHEVTVLERAERFEPLGTGLALWPNGARALREVGIGATADAAEVPRGDGGIRRARDGKLITAISPEVLERRYGAPLALVHRAELQGALLAAAGDGVVRFGAEAREVDAEGAVGLVTGERLEAHVVVGPDGIISAIRAALRAPSYLLDERAGGNSGQMPDRQVDRRMSEACASGMRAPQ